MRIRQVPRLEFVVDSGIVAGQRVEDILREIHQREASAREHGGAGDEEES
jgi:ribosome-binding factor A